MARAYEYDEVLDLEPQLDENGNILIYEEVFERKGHDTMIEMLVGEAFILKLEERNSNYTEVITAASKNFRGPFREMIEYFKDAFFGSHY